MAVWMIVLVVGVVLVLAWLVLFLAGARGSGGYLSGFGDADQDCDNRQRSEG